MIAQVQAEDPVVVCPECKHAFPLTKALTGPIEAAIARQLETEYQKRDRERAGEFERCVAEASAAAVETAHAAEAMELAELRQEAQEQRETITRMQEQELAQRKRARELEARERALALDVERQVDARAATIEEEVAMRISEQHRLKDQEKDKQLADLRHQLEDVTRKAQQGSQQLQGEVAELDLEAQLRQAFPNDEIKPISAGQRGADILQRVRDARGQVYGTILYEVKNTKTFSDAWLPKLREDQRERGAELAVLVTTVLPKDVVTFASRGGAWVSGFSAFLALAHALRWGLIEVARTRVIAEGQAGKQAELLAYCGGTEFKQRIEAMLEPVIAMIDDFDKERQMIETAWARRRKRNEQIVKGLAGLYGDVGAIIGTLPRLARLELPPGPDGKAA